MPASPDLVDQEQISDNPNNATRTVEVRAQALREYISGRSLDWYTAIPRSLPWAIDDITADIADDIYERILLDPQARSTVNVLKASVLEEGLQLSPAIEDKEEDGYDQAVELHDRAERMFDEIDTDAFLWDMLDAVALGNRVAEQVFQLGDNPAGTGQQYVITTLSVKPRESYAFVVDVFLNVLGLLGRIPGEPFGVQQGLWLTDIEHAPNLLPRSKFAILTFRPRNNDPRGTSVLRAAYDPWNQKQQLKREFLKYLTQFATPTLVGYTSELSQPYALFDADGNPLVGTSGQPVMRTPEEDMGAALGNLGNGSYAVFPFGSKTQPIEMSGDGQPFLRAFDFLDRQITKAVLQQTLATEEGEHQTRAASGTHKDILDTVTRQAKRPVERMVRRDILSTWCRLNGEEKLLELLPHVTLGTLENEDIAAQRNSIAALEKAGYLHPSQYPGIDIEIGLPERDPASLIEPPPMPAPVPGQAPAPAPPSIPEQTPAQDPAAPSPEPVSV